MSLLERMPGMARNTSSMNFCAANDGSRVGEETCAGTHSSCEQFSGQQPYFSALHAVHYFWGSTNARGMECFTWHAAFCNPGLQDSQTSPKVNFCARVPA